MLDAARDVMAMAEQAGCEIVLPKDVVVAREFFEGAAVDTVSVNAVPADKMILDVGPQSVVDLNNRLSGLKAFLWTGPLGAFETFDTATNAVAQEAARLTQQGGLLSVAGGAETVAALVHAGVEAQFSYVSTAGVAFSEWLEGRTLPGVNVLRA